MNQCVLTIFFEKPLGKALGMDEYYDACITIYCTDLLFF